MWVLMLTCPALAVETPPSTTTPSIDFQQALQLTEQETKALSSVRDGTGHLDEPAFYLLAHKAASVALLEQPPQMVMDQPAWQNLMRFPHRYRGWPMQAMLKIYRIEKLTVGEGLSPSPHWPADKCLWKMSGLDIMADEPANEPIVVFSVIEPEAFKKSGTSDSRQVQFPDGLIVEVTGFFYKRWRYEDLQGEVRSCPVVLAWNVSPMTSDVSTVLLPRRDWTGEIIAIVLATLLVAYLIVRRYVRRPKHPSTYRAIFPDNEPSEGNGHEEDRQSHDVDPLLRQAAEKYRERTDDENRSS